MVSLNGKQKQPPHVRQRGNETEISCKPLLLGSLLTGVLSYIALGAHYGALVNSQGMSLLIGAFVYLLRREGCFAGKHCLSCEGDRYQVDDFGVSAEHRLVVSDTALELLRQVQISHSSVSVFSAVPPEI